MSDKISLMFIRDTNEFTNSLITTIANQLNIDCIGFDDCKELNDYLSIEVKHDLPDIILLDSTESACKKQLFKTLTTDSKFDGIYKIILCTKLQTTIEKELREVTVEEIDKISHTVLLSKNASSLSLLHLFLNSVKSIVKLKKMHSLSSKLRLQRSQNHQC